MHIRYTFRNIQNAQHGNFKESIRTIVQEEFSPLLQGIGEDRARLAVQVDFFQKKGTFSVAFRLHLPKKVLVSREENKDLDLAIKESLDELKRQLNKYISRIRKEYVWKRKFRRTQLRKLKVATESAHQEQRQVYYDLIKTHLPKLQRVVRHELTYMRAKGDLPPDYPSIEDVIDETLVRAYKTVKERLPLLSVDTWLIQIAIDVIAEEVASFRAEDGLNSLELSVSPLELIPEDEIFEFWQPDEMLTIEDLASRERAISAQEPAEQRERRIYLYRLLAFLPVKWRRALNLLLLEGLPRAQIASILGTDESTIEEWIRHSEAFLFEKMKEAGYELPEEGSCFDFLAPVEDPEEYRQQAEEELKETLNL